MKKIAIIGAGGFAKEVAFLIECINLRMQEPAWQILGYIDREFNSISHNGKYPIIGDENYLINYGSDISIALGVGQPSIIRNVIKKLEKYSHIKYPNLMHPDVIMDRERISLIQGNVICAGNVFTTDISIGSFNIFNLSSTYGHDMVISDYCVFNPGVNMSGGIKVQNECLVGTGATVLQYKTLGTGAIIGAGSVVVKDVPPGVTVIGVPAKPLTK